MFPLIVALLLLVSLLGVTTYILLRPTEQTGGLGSFDYRQLR